MKERAKDNLRLYKWEDKWLVVSVNPHPVETRDGVFNHFTHMFDTETDARLFIIEELEQMQDRLWDYKRSEWELEATWATLWTGDVEHLEARHENG